MSTTLTNESAWWYLTSFLILDGVLASLRDSDWKTAWPAQHGVKIMDFMTPPVIVGTGVPSVTLKKSLGYL